MYVNGGSSCRSVTLNFTLASSTAAHALPKCLVLTVIVLADRPDQTGKLDQPFWDGHEPVYEKTMIDRVNLISFNSDLIFGCAISYSNLEFILL